MKTIKTYNDYLIEGSVRDKMTPIDITEIKKRLEQMFNIARKDENIELDSEFYFDVWEPLSEEYNIIDNYYMYDGGVYFLYTPTDEYGKYQLSYTFEDVTKFREKLENAIKKIDSLS